MKTIGETIKAYRSKNSMTQEQLAARLNVTPQTVSKWETNVSCPDLSLILPLTKLFRITADELLGIGDTDDDKRQEELNTAYERTFRTEDFAARQSVCETAVSEYPGDMQWLCRLAWVTSNRSFEYEDSERYLAEQEKAIRLFDAVIKNCKDDVLRGNAIVGITQLLGWRGRREEAKKYADMLPDKSMVTRESVMENLLEGDDLLRFKQKRIMQHLHGILWDLSLMPQPYTDLMRTLAEVMFPDGNCLEFHHTLYFANRKEIERIRRENPDAREMIPALLAQMKHHAAEYDKIVFSEPGIYRYTAPWFDRIAEDTREWLGNEGESLTQDMEAFMEKMEGGI